MTTADTAAPSPALPKVPVSERLRTALGLTPSGPHYFFYRHGGMVRLSHWINALCLAILLMSGLNIFNAHPALYWGKTSHFDHPALMLGALTDESGYPVQGVTSIGNHQFNTTGLLVLPKKMVR